MESPDWDYWNQRKHIAIWEAAALAIDANPLEVKALYRKGFRVPIDHPIEKEFRKRLEILADNCIGQGWQRLRERSFKQQFLVAQITTFTVSKGWAIPDEMRKIANQAGHTAEDLMRTSDATVQTATSTHPKWQDRARAIADKLHLSDLAADAHDSVKSIADRVAAKMREQNIEGPRGPLTGASVLRGALQGAQWKRPQKAAGNLGNTEIP